MNVFLFNLPGLDGGSAYNKEFCRSLIPNLLCRGLGYYFHLLRLDRYGVMAYGTPAEMDALEGEERRRLFGE